MNDLFHLVNEMCAWLGGPETIPLSTSVETLSTLNVPQPIDKNRSFHSFQSFHSKSENHSLDDWFGTEISNFPVEGSRANELPQKSMEIAERGERGEKTLEETTDYLFPLTTKRVERVEREGASCERLALDLNRAGPQRGDWWDGDHLAALAPQLVPGPVLDESLPIQPAEVQAGVEREVRALAALGRTGPDALRDAIVITAAKIRNAPALSERQAHDGRCHACGEPLDGTRPEVAILQAKGGSHLWVHAGECHSEHSQRRAVLVEAIMAAAGYGADRQSESAA